MQRKRRGGLFLDLAARDVMDLSVSAHNLLLSVCFIYRRKQCTYHLGVVLVLGFADKKIREIPSVLFAVLVVKFPLIITMFVVKF